MRYVLALHPRNIGLYVLALTLVFLVACGAAAPAAPVTLTPPPASEQQVETPAQPAPQQPAAPVSEPTPTPIVPQATVPSGTLNVGEKELGRFSGLPKNGTNPALFVISTVLTEGLVTQWEPVASKVHPMLAESWSVSDDYLVWTFNLRKGVQFHKGYGEMTAEDVAWSYVEGWAKNETHVRYDVLHRFWASPDGYVEVKDSHTLEVHTGVPMSQPLLFDMARNPGGSGTWIGSKRQVEDVGEAAADRMIAATGSWEIVDHQPGQFWKMQAVQDHWRQTPHFAELIFWEIPEESSRLAGFQTGQLDTFSMAFDSIPLVESIPGARIMRVPNAGIMTLRFYGMYHLDAGTPNQRAAYNPDFAWISASADVNSVEWQNAAKVRRALRMAVDTDTLIETLLWGYGRHGLLGIFEGHEHQFDPDMEWEYNPDRARELLAEAGFPNGFNITVTPALRGAPAEVEACEAMANMWENIGVSVRLQRIPYETLRPQIVGRTYAGATCHGSSPAISPVRGFVSLSEAASFNLGVTHPWLEDIIPRAQAAIDPAELESLERQVARFMFDHTLTNIGIYSFDNVWPVGPGLDDADWEAGVRHADARNMNGFEYIRRR